MAIAIPVRIIALPCLLAIFSVPKSASAMLLVNHMLFQFQMRSNIHVDIVDQEMRYDDGRRVNIFNEV